MEVLVAFMLLISVALAVWILSLYFTLSQSKTLIGSLDNVDWDVSDIQEEQETSTRYASYLLGTMSVLAYSTLPLVIVGYIAIAVIFLLFTIFNGIAVLMVLFSAYALTQVLVEFFRDRTSSDFEIEATTENFPALIEFNSELAGILGVEPANRIFVLANVDLSVVQTGTFRQRASGKCEKQLRVGFPLLKGMTTRDLAPLLAHEYGHFAHPNFAMVNVLYFFLQSAERVLSTMEKKDPARVLNVGYWLLRVVRNSVLTVFSRYKQRQETLADLFSLRAFGTDVFKSSMNKYLQVMILFQSRLQLKVEAFLSDSRQRKLESLYDRDSLTRALTTQEQETLNKLMGERLQRFDTHPPYEDRIHLADKVALNPSSEVAEGLVESPSIETELMTRYTRILKVNR